MACPCKDIKEQLELNYFAIEQFLLMYSTRGNESIA